MTAVLFVVAAALGSAVRHVLQQRWPGSPLPLGTLAVNLAGSFALGLLAGWDPPGATIVGVGGLGALTTFSTFAAQSFEIGGSRRPWLAAYVGLSVIGGVAMAWLGLRLA